MLYKIQERTMSFSRASKPSKKPVSNTSNINNNNSKQTYCPVEQILKDFLTYLEGFQKRFHRDGAFGLWGASMTMLGGGCVGGSPGSSHHYNHSRKRQEWTPQEANKHKERLRFFGRALGDQMKRLPRDNRIVKNILETMKSAIREGMRADNDGRRHVEILMETTSKLLHIVQPVDLEKLIALMKINREAGDCMDNQDVVLLLGSSGAGKTTTLHFLAGTSFTEVEVDGFFHLLPTDFVDRDVVGYETSSGGIPVTKSVQTAHVTIDGRDVVICDTPGFGGENKESIEEDIANGLGIVRALHRANTVRPVLVLSREGMGDRFSAFSETLSSAKRLLGNFDTIDLKPFNYMFTKYEKRHRACMCRQFILIRKRPRVEEQSKVMFRTLVDDIIQKTTPEAKIVLPMEEGPHSLLRKVLYDEQVVTEPREYFIPFVSDSALRKLKLQLQITLRDIMASLSEEDYGLAIYRMKQLSNLAMVLPEAGECAQLGLEASLRHIGAGRERVASRVDHALEIKAHKQYTQIIQALKNEIGHVLETEQLRKVCAHFEKHSFSERRRALEENDLFCARQIQRLADIISTDVPQFDPKFLNTELLMKQRGSFLTAVVRLKEMSEILYDVPGDQYVAVSYKNAFNQFYTFVECLLSEAEHDFHTSPKDVQSFERQAWFLAVLIQGFLNKPNSGTGEHEKMEELENRRLKLMLRLEIKISDTMELVDDTRFPEEDCNDEKDSSPCSLPLVKLGGLRGPRQMLLSVARLPRLCKFLPSNLDIIDVERCVTILDDKVVNFLWRTVVKAESGLRQLEYLKKDGDINVALNEALSMRHDLKMVVEEFTGVRRWSSQLEEETKESWGRLLIVQDSVDSSIKTIEATIEEILRRKTEGLGFTCGVLSSSYMCNTKQIAK